MSNDENMMRLVLEATEMKGKLDCLESEVKWLREVVAVLMSKMTQAIYTPPVMDMKQWSELIQKGPTSHVSPLTVGEGVVPLSVGVVGKE